MVLHNFSCIPMTKQILYDVSDEKVLRKSNENASIFNIASVPY